MESYQTIFNDNLNIYTKRFREIDTESSFFDSFKNAYGPYYFEWLKEKKNDDVIVVENPENHIIGFLKLKIEDPTEDYSDILPIFKPAKRIKISSLKALPNTYKVGSKLMEISLKKAAQEDVDEIYATILQNCEYYERMVGFLKKWGFQIVGTKYSHNLMEDVLSLSLKYAE